MMLVWMLLEKTLGWHDAQIADHKWITMLFVPFAVFMYVLAMRETRRRFYNRKITWLQGFLSGLIITIFIALLSPLAQYLTHNYITPEYFENVKDYSITNKLMTIETANEYFNLNTYLLQSFFGALLGGVLTSAIVAIFLRRS
jgi:hypothetical protein